MSTNESVGHVASGLLSSIGAALSTHFQDKMLKKLDTDGSGGVGQSEFQAAMDKAGTKFGLDLGQGASSMFTSADANSDGSLDADEVGQVIRNLFMPPDNTQAFVQSRGDETRFAELDTDGDGQISKAEFGIASAQPDVAIVSTTTTTTTTVIGSTAEDASSTDAVASAATDPAPAVADPLIALMNTVDKDGDGQISGDELNQFVAQLSSQLEAASKKYNDVALGATTNNGLSEAA